jgi:multicomponent Na+:H+ antiporter subunit D
VTDAQLILWALCLPTLGAAAVLALGRSPNLRDSASSVATLLTFGAVVQLLPRVMDGERPAVELLEVMPGVRLAFEVEPLGMLYALVASGLWIITSLYAVGYMRGHHEDNQTRFFIFFALAISAALGIAFAANLFTLFLFYEVLTFSTFPLVTHHGNEAAKKAGRVYLGILVSTSVAFLLFAVLWTWQATGTLEFRPGGILAGKVRPAHIPVLLGLYAFGTGKAALMPFHRWLPAAMVAPTPVSALLHAVAVVKAGVFTVLKVVVYVFGIETLASTGASRWLMYAAAFTILSASLVALTKDNLKARLAYSTISQLAYIVLGAALATASGVLGGGMHIAMHAVGKITLFFCAGAIYVGAHKTEISTMNGIGRRMPFTMGAYLLGSLSIIGLPPFGGAWSKWYLVLGAAEGDQLVFVFVLMASSLLSIGYLMPLVVRAFFYEPDADDDDGHGHGHGQTSGIQEAPFLCVLPLCVAAAGCVALFFTTQHLYALLSPIVGGP